MGTIVCQHCSSTIGHVEGEKVSILYGKCSHNNGCSQNNRGSIKVK